MAHQVGYRYRLPLPDTRRCWYGDCPSMGGTLAGKRTDLGNSRRGPPWADEYGEGGFVVETRLMYGDRTCGACQTTSRGTRQTLWVWGAVLNGVSALPRPHQPDGPVRDSLSVRLYAPRCGVTASPFFTIVRSAWSRPSGQPYYGPAYRLPIHGASSTNLSTYMYYLTAGKGVMYGKDAHWSDAHRWTASLYLKDRRSRARGHLRQAQPVFGGSEGTTAWSCAHWHGFMLYNL